MQRAKGGWAGQWPPEWRTSRVPLGCSSPMALSLMDTTLPLVSSMSTCEWAVGGALL